MKTISTNPPAYTPVFQSSLQDNFEGADLPVHPHVLFKDAIARRVSRISGDLSKSVARYAATGPKDVFLRAYRAAVVNYHVVTKSSAHVSQVFVYC